MFGEFLSMNIIKNPYLAIQTLAYLFHNAVQSFNIAFTVLHISLVKRFTMDDILGITLNALQFGDNNKRISIVEQNTGDFDIYPYINVWIQYSLHPL